MAGFFSADVTHRGRLSMNLKVQRGGGGVKGRVYVTDSY